MQLPDLWVAPAALMKALLQFFKVFDSPARLMVYKVNITQVNKALPA